MFAVPSGGYLGVELVSLCFTLCETARLFSTVATPFHIPPRDSNGRVYRPFPGVAPYGSFQLRVVRVSLQVSMWLGLEVMDDRRPFLFSFSYNLKEQTPYF